METYLVCENCNHDIVDVSRMAVRNGAPFCSHECMRQVITYCRHCHEFVSYSDAWLVNGAWFCADCHTRRFQTCENCGEIKSVSLLVEDVDGKRICSDCRANYYLRCEECYGYVLTEDAECGGGDVLCQECYTRYYFRCGTCTRITHRSEDEGDSLCESCRDRLVGVDHSDCIHYYSYKPTPQFFATRTENEIRNAIVHGERRFFGTEVEVQFQKANKGTMAELADARPELYCKEDGSLRHGVEIVSHPLSLSYHKDAMQWDKLMSELVANGTIAHYATNRNGDQSCGLHVHVSKDSIEESNIVKLFCFYLSNLDKFKILARRETNVYAQNIPLYGPEDISTVERKVTDYNLYSDHHDCIAVTKHTLEFRLNRGTLRYETFIATLESIDSTIRFVENSTLSAYDYISTPTWRDYTVYCQTKRQDYPMLIDYMNQRGVL